MKTTAWFPPHINPVRVGWYSRASEVCADNLRYMNWWDGENWHYNSNTKSHAAAGEPDTICDADFYSWRGLAKGPR